MDEHERCLNCRFALWQGEPSVTSEGNCRRSGPMGPTIFGHDWCGEWQGQRSTSLGAVGGIAYGDGWKDGWNDRDARRHLDAKQTNIKTEEKL